MSWIHTRGQNLWQNVCAAEWPEHPTTWRDHAQILEPVFCANGSHWTKFHRDCSHFVYSFPLNLKLWGSNYPVWGGGDRMPTQYNVLMSNCKQSAKNEPDPCSRFATIHTATKPNKWKYMIWRNKLTLTPPSTRRSCPNVVNLFLVAMVVTIYSSWLPRLSLLLFTEPKILEILIFGEGQLAHQLK